MTPTALSLRLLRSSGYLAATVERWIPDLGQKRDLFGIADLMGVHRHRRPSVILIQCTTREHLGDRIKRIRSRQELPTVLAAGVVVEAWGWFRGAGGWDCKRIGITEAGEVDVVIPARRRRSKQPELFA